MPQVGEAWIDVHADGSGLFREIREIANRAAAGAKITLKVDLDTKGLNQKVKAAAAAASRSAKIEFRTDLDAKTLGARVKAAARAASGAVVKVKADLDTSGLRVGRRIKIDADVEDDFAAVAARARRALAERPIEIPIKADVKQLDFAVAQAGTSVRRGFRGFRSAFSEIAAASKGGLGAVATGAKEATADVGLLSGAVGGFLAAMGTVAKFGGAQLGLVALGAAAALPFIEALGVAVAGLAVDLGSAALGVAGFAASGLVAIGVGAGTVVIGLQGIGNALGDLNKIRAKQSAGIKVSKNDWKAYRAELAKLAPSARQFIGSLDDLRGTWHELQGATQQHLFAGLGAELEQTAKVLLPTLKSGLTGVADVVNGVATDFLTWARSAEGVAQINSILTQSKVVLGDLGEAAGNVGGGLLTLFTGGKKNAEGLGGAFVDLTQKFQDWTTEITTPGKGGTTPLEDFFTTARTNLGKVKGLLGSSGGLIESFWANWTGAGENRPDILGDLQGQLEEWSAALRDPKNAGAIKDFIGQAKTDFDTVTSAVVGVASGINQISDAINLLDTSRLDSLPDKINNALGTGTVEEDMATIQSFLDGFNLGGAPPANVNWQFNDQPSTPAPWTAGQVGSTETGDIAVSWNWQQDPSKPPPWGSQPGRQTNVGGIAEVDWRYAEQSGNRPPWATPNQGAPPGGDAGGGDKGLEIHWTWAQAPEGAPPWSNPNQAANGNKQTASVLVDWDWKTLPLSDSNHGPWSQPGQQPEPVEVGWKWAELPKGESGTHGPWSQPTNMPPVIPFKGEIQIDPPVKDQLTTLIEDLPSGGLIGGIGGKVKITVDMNGKIVSVEPYTGPPIPVPLEPQMPTDGPGFAPTLPPLPWPITPDTSGFLGLNGKLTGAIGNITVPVGYHVGPLPTLPSPHITVPIGYRKGPFPKLPSPHITVPVKYSVAPFPSLPHPTITVPVRFDVKDLGLGGVVSGFTPDKNQLSGFTPDAAAHGVKITHGPQLYRIGEAGPEAVIPLTSGPLDPAVTTLLRSVAASRGMGARDTKGPLIGTLNVSAPTGDPEAVAMMVANRLSDRVVR